MTTETAPAPKTERTPDELVGRLFAGTLGMMDVMAVYVGDQLGLYRALRDRGSATPAELAKRAGIDERYAREWLEQQAVSGMLDVDDASAAPDERRFTLPEAYAEPLLNKNSPFSVAPLARSIVACAKVLPQLMTAYRTGGGVEWADYGPDMIEAQGDFNRPWLLGSFGTEILPAMPQIDARLRADPPARVADVACGVGWAAIAIAKAYLKDPFRWPEVFQRNTDVVENPHWIYPGEVIRISGSEVRPEVLARVMTKPAPKPVADFERTVFSTVPALVSDRISGTG